jgi:hypothetical protein
MPDNPKLKELGAALAKLENEWQELAHLLKDQAQSPSQALEVEKILLRDASGIYRGKLGVQENGSAGLFLSDREGKARAWLGVNQSGEAFLELKDQQREVRFKVPVGPALAAEPEESAVAPVPERNPEAAPQPIELPEVSPQPAITPEEGGSPPGEPAAFAPPAATSEAAPPPDDAEGEVLRRLEKWERRQRRQGWVSVLILCLLGVVLASQAFVLLRFPPIGPLKAEGLALRDHKGILRAWLGEALGEVGLKLRDQAGKLRLHLGLGAEGSPDLAFYDQDQRVRMEMKLKPDGEPQINAGDKLALPGPTAQRGTESAAPPPQVVTPAGSGAGAAAAPAAPRAEAAGPEREAEAEVLYVGSKTSNKYHYPTCSWAKTIRPSNMITFKSAAEAQARHYIPCPVCKPPPLSK